MFTSPLRAYRIWGGTLSTAYDAAELGQYQTSGGAPFVG
jgi:hypothetical protein